MSTQRYISTSFWDDGWVAELAPNQKLFYLYLLTNPLTNIAGIYQVTDKRLRFDTGFSTRVVAGLWSYFSNEKKIVRMDDWVIIPSWPKHQRVGQRTTVRQGIDAILKKLPDDVLKAVIVNDYRYPYLTELDRVSDLMIDDDRLSEGASYLDSDSDPNSDTDTDPDADSIETQLSKVKARVGLAPNGGASHAT